MEAGGIDVGHVFARLDAKLDDRNFKRFDRAVDDSKRKAREMGGETDRLSRSTRGLTREQESQVRALREQGDGWGAVARKLGLAGSALRGFRSGLQQSEQALKSHTRATRDSSREQDRYTRSTRESTREQERSRRSTKDSERSFIGLDGAIARVNRGASFFSRTLRLLKWPALIVGAGAALQGLNALSGGVVALVSALAPLSGLLVTIPAGLGTLVQALGIGALAVMGVKDAVKALSDQEAKSAKTAESNAQQQRSAARQIRSAKEQVVSAEERLDDAERTSTDSTQQLSEARREAVVTLQDMRNAAIEARLGEQGAQLSLRRAIADLWKAQEDPSSSMLDIEELELRVHESKLQVKEARQENKRTQEENNRAQRAGVKKDPGVVAAERAVVEAKRDVVRAEADVAKAGREVVETQRDVKESLSETDAAANKVRETFSKLNPEAAKFSRFLFGLKPRLEGLQETASKGFLPGAERGIKSAIRNLPVLDRIVGGTSRVLGTITERVGRLFGSKGFGRDLEVVGKGNARTLGLLGRSAEHLTKGLTNVLVVAQPFLKFAGRYVNHLSAWIERSTKVNRKNGDMAKFFGRTRQVVEVLTSIFQSLGATLHVIGEESAPLGREILKAFDEGAEGLEKWSESTKGRNSIAQYFEDARGPLWEAGRLVRDIVKAFFDLGDGEGMDSIENLLHALRVELLPVFTEVTKETTASFGPHLVELLTQVLGLFGRLAGNSGPLTLYVDTLTAAATVTNTLLDAVPGLRGLVVNLLGVVAVMKTIHGLGKFTGITKGLELIFGPEMGGKLRGRFVTMMKGVFVRGALAMNLAATWGGEVASQAAGGISKQIGRFRAVARRAAIAFIGVFAPEVAAGMAAGGRLGEVLSARFPKLAGMFKGGGKMAGRAFLVGLVLGVVLIGAELGKAFAKAHPKVARDMTDWGINAGQNFVNGLIFAVNKGIDAINFTLDKANVLSIIGVDAPNIGHVGKVDFKSPDDIEREQRKKSSRQTQKHLRRKGFKPGEVGTEITGGGDSGHVPKGQIPGEFRERREGEARRSRRGDRKPEDEAKDTRKKVGDEHRKMRRDVDDETSRLQRSVLDRFGKIRKGGTEESKRLNKAVTGSVQDMRGVHDRNTSAMLSATDTRFEGMRTVVSQRSSAMREDLVANVGEMNETTSEGMDQIQAAVVKALKAFGVKNVDLDLTPGDKGKPKRSARKAAQGGVFTVPGEGMQDTVYLPGVHAMVAPGEDLFVATRHQQPLLDLAVANTFGVGGLDDFFSTFDRPHFLARGGRAGRYAGGGMVDVPADPDHASDPNDSVAALIVGAVNSWIKRYHANITAAFDPSGGHLSPGHNFTGTATDVVPAGGWTTAATRLFEQGLRYLVGKGFEVLYDGRAGTIAYPNHGRGNHAHIEWVGNGTVPDAIAHLGGMAGLQRIKDLVVEGTPGTEKTLVQLALNRVTKGANKYLQHKTGMGREGGEHGVNVPLGPIKRMGREMVVGTWGQSEWPPFNALELSEAGWDPRAENPESGAAGLAQALPPSKYPPGAWPYRGPRSARLQLQWMVDYIKERYGTPAAAWSFHQANNWYARGGRALRRFASGGSFKGNINHRYAPHWAPDYGGQTLPSYVVAALDEAAGMPGRTMEQVTRGESGAHRKNSARPGSAGVDAGGTKGYGLHAITWPFANSIVRKYGGYGEMWNPVKNAAAAKEVLETNGLGAWYGTGSVTGSNLHYKGKYDIRNALGGMSFKEALGGRRTPGKESIQGERRAKKGGDKKKRKRSTGHRRGVSSQDFAEAPRGKYNPQALMRVMEQTGIGLPYTLLMNGVPNWRGYSPVRYREIVDTYYQKVAEYRQTLTEEQQQAAESWKASPLLGTVTPLSEDMISTALRFHSPITSDISSYRLGLSALGNLDQRAEGTRSSYLNTFTESYLRPYREKETTAEYIHEGTLKSINPRAEAKAFAEAKLKGLHKRIERLREGKKRGPKAQRAIAAAEVAKGRRKGRKRSGRRFARGGRVLASFAKGGKGKVAVGSALNTAKPTTAAQIRKKTQAEIRRHNQKTKKRAERRRQHADERYEAESEGVLDPVEREREEIEEREQYETARREELASFLSEVAGNVQKTAVVGRAQSSLFGSTTFFARGGAVPPAAAPPLASTPSGNAHVTVPLSVRLSGAMEALNPHIEALVDGKLRDLGRAAGGAQTTVSAPGRRVSYGGK